MKNQRTISFVNAVKIFLGFTVYFYLLLFLLFPFMKGNFEFHGAVYWFITGYFLFIPMFGFAVRSVIQEETTSRLSAMAVRRLSKSDWGYASMGLLVSFVLSGTIFGISMLLHQKFGFRLLETTPWFMEMSPFHGWEKLLLLIWLPMFFFNIVGEEILWRGYIQKRMTGKYAWLICATLWAVFHLPFGLDMIIMAAPVLLIIPFFFHRTGNTSVGIVIHAVYNGPVFVLISLGIIK